MHAANSGYAPRFLRCFVALSFFCLDSESILTPTAANADHWAVCLKRLFSLLKSRNKKDH
jgi:hypothetical protein